MPIGTKNYYNHFKLQAGKEKVIFSDHINVHTIELEKFANSLEEVDNSLEKWSYFLKHGENLEDAHLPSQLATPEIKDAIKELKMFTKDEIERERYESRRKALMDHNSLLADHYETGLEKGFQKGEQSGFQKTVANALYMGLDIEAIATLTGLGLDTIKEMKKAHFKPS